MFSGRSWIEVWGTPYDETAPEQIESRICLLYEQAKGPILSSDYSFNMPLYFEALGGAITRGIYVGAVLDHTQFTTPTEAKAFTPFINRYPAPFKSQDIVIGTSSRGAGFIAHSKKRVVNAPILGYDVPDGDYETLDAALAAGYPIVQMGSLNLTTHAAEQVNDVIFLTGKVVAAMVASQILAERAWIVQTQQRYQPFPHQEASA